MKQDLILFNTIVQAFLNAESSEPVAQTTAIEQLPNNFDISLQHDGIDDQQLIPALTKIVTNTPKTSSNRFFNQLFGGRQSKAYLGELLSVVLNSSMYTYKVGGVQVALEKEIINQVKSIINYPAASGGTMAPGGSLANLMGMIMARDSFAPEIAENGNTSGLVLYTSKESHYSIPKNAAFMGLGRKAVRYIDTDEYGKMDTVALEHQILKDKQAGLKPFLVIATAGTTVLGAFDPVDQIRPICDRYSLWLHVDGAYCGAVIMSNRYKSLLKSVNTADSFCFNAHKMFGTPLSCSIILAKDYKQFHYSFSNDASYLFQMHDDGYNLGKVSLQCGRRNDALKFWTLWKSVGLKGLEKIVDHQFALANTARDYIRNNPDYTLYSFDDSISICFNYKDIEPKKLCADLCEQQKLMVSYGTYNNQDFIRLVTINSENEHTDVLEVFKIIESFCTQYYKEASSSAVES